MAALHASAGSTFDRVPRRHGSPPADHLGHVLPPVAKHLSNRASIRDQFGIEPQLWPLFRLVHRIYPLSLLAAPSRPISTFSSWCPSCSSPLQLTTYDRSGRSYQRNLSTHLEDRLRPYPGVPSPSTLCLDARSPTARRRAPHIARSRISSGMALSGSVRVGLASRGGPSAPWRASHAWRPPAPTFLHLVPTFSANDLSNGGHPAMASRCHARYARI